MPILSSSPDPVPDVSETTLYERIGGAATFRALVEAFYSGVEHDPILRPMFPADLTEGKRWQFLFLSQYFGGPADYNAERGHPRLRMRHFPFPIDERAAAAWLAHMLAAIDAVGIAEPDRTEMRTYFQNGAAFLINQGPR
jgi:hemoglobin